MKPNNADIIKSTKQRNNQSSGIISPFKHFYIYKKNYYAKKKTNINHDRVALQNIIMVK